MKISQLDNVLNPLLEENIVPLIIGDAGIGKSEAVKAYADRNGLDFYDMRVGTMSDSGDIVGLPFSITDKEGNKVATKFLTPSYMPRSGKGILFLDETNRGNKEVMQAIFQLILDRRVGEYVLPKGWKVVAAQNPATEDYDVLDFKDMAFLDRFAQIKLETTVDDWSEWARSKELDEAVIAWAKEFPELAKAKRKEFIIEAKSTFRSLTRFTRFRTNALKAGVDEEIIKEIGHGMIGLDAVGSLYVYFEKRKNERLNVADVLANLKKYEKQIIEFSGANNNRNDLLRVLFDDLMVHLETNTLSEKEETNLLKLCIITPKDLAHSYIINFTKNEKILKQLLAVPNSFLDNTEKHKSLIEHFKGKK